MEIVSHKHAPDGSEAMFREFGGSKCIYLLEKQN